MMRRSFALLSAVACVALAPATTLRAQESRPLDDLAEDGDRFSRDQLENLVSAIALYPDALLAQVLVAATFPDQVEDAARFVRQNGTTDIDDQPWDVSVKAIAHYPSALNMMAEKEDWTAALGRAYALQSGDVMAAVQRLRAMADAQGNLRTTPQQVVTRDQDDYVIAPAQPRVIYVPVYDPYVVYTRPIFATASYYTPFWSFGIGFPIGAWLGYDVNWRSRAVYYNGWDVGYAGYAGGWRVRSRPFIQFTTIYTSPRYRTVYFNRDVVRRRIEYRNIDRYVGVHRETRFSRDYDRGVRTQYDRPRNDFRNDSRYGNGGYGTPIYRNDVRYGAPARDEARRDDRTRDDRSRDDRGRVSTGGFGSFDGYRVYGGSAGQRDQGQYRGREEAGGTRGTYDVPAGGMDRSRDNRGNDMRGGEVRGGDAGSDRQPDMPQGGGWRDRGGMRPDGGDRGGRGQDARGPEVRGPFSRTEMPMVNPRRAEPAQQGPGGRQGGERGARERPLY